jgi:hypothetical protein
VNKITPIHSADSLRRRGNSFKAILEDTRDLLEVLGYRTEEDAKAAKFQIEAINQVLTADSKPD